MNGTTETENMTCRSTTDADELEQVQRIQAVVMHDLTHVEPAGEYVQLTRLEELEAENKSLRTACEIHAERGDEGWAEVQRLEKELAAKAWPATKEIVLPRDEAGRTPDPFASVLALASAPWKINGIATLLHEAGEIDIPTRAEAEMAAALHWMLGLVFRHGEEWGAAYGAEIVRMKQVVQAKTPAVSS